MGRGILDLRPRGSDTVFRRVESERTTAVKQCPSIKLNYPRNQLLLGTAANMDNRCVNKALDTQYPLELSIECAELPPERSFFLSRRAPILPRPFAVIYFRSPRGGPWELIGRTETVLHDEYVRFVTKLKLSCSTVSDRLKEIRVVVYDRRTVSDDLREQRLIGTVECRLDDIVSESLLRKSFPIRNVEKDSTKAFADRGQLILSADIIRPVAGDIVCVFDVDIGSSAQTDKRLFYVLSRQIRSGDYTPIYRSEVLEKDQIRFQVLTRTLGAITAGVEGKLLRLDLYQYCPKGSHLKLGFMQTSITKLREAEVGERQLWWPAHNEPGALEVGRVVLIDRDMDDESAQFHFRFFQ